MTLSSPTLVTLPTQLDSPRLHMRVLQQGDGAILNAAVVESFANLHRWIPWARELPSVADSETFARESAATFRVREQVPMLLFRRQDGVLVGSSGLHHMLWDIPAFEIGYWLRDSAVGQGYMLEAVQAQVQMAFETLQAERLVIRCDALNTRSAAVARRAGFMLEGRLRHDHRNNYGELADMLLFSLLREDYAAVRQQEQG